MRYDKETGALADRELPPSTSASDNSRFLKRKEDVDHPFAYPGIYLLVGTLGSGKSSLIYSILNELDEILNPKELGRILYYSGSGKDKILEHYDDTGIELYDQKSKESFLTALQEINTNDLQHNEKKMNIIVVDDGIMDSDLMSKSVQSTTPLSKILMSVRHIPAHVMITSQKMSAIGTFARTNCQHLFVFRCKTPAERQAILKESNFSKQEVEDALDSLTEPTSFAWFNSKDRKIVKNLTVPLVH